MGQTSGLLSSSFDGSDDGSSTDASYDEIVVPSPVLPFSHDSLELGFQPCASVPHVSSFDDEPPGMVSSSGDDSDDELINRLRRERSEAQASSATRAAAIRARRNIRVSLADDFDEDLDTPPAKHLVLSFMGLTIAASPCRRSKD